MGVRKIKSAETLDSLSNDKSVIKITSSREYFKITNHVKAMRSSV